MGFRAKWRELLLGAGIWSAVTRSAREKRPGSVLIQGPPGFGGAHDSWFELIWVLVDIIVPFWIPIIRRHPIFRVPKKGP